MFGVAIHGGAGALTPGLYSQEEEKSFQQQLRTIINTAHDSLSNGEKALNVVTSAVKSLEDSPLFNAGRGSVFDANGEITMDASVMCGQTLRVGGVAQLKIIKNPIEAARWVLEHSRHSIIAREFLESHLKQIGLTCETPDYFKVDKRYQQYLEAKAQGKVVLDHGSQDSNTVGAVARDRHGNLAAATSTGGLTGKFPGRISDSSLCGSGTYANNATCALSATGTGDVFMQMHLCHNVHALMTYAHLSLQEACEKSLVELQRLGGMGGVIAIDRNNEIFMPFNSPGMFRAERSQGAMAQVHIY